MAEKHAHSKIPNYTLGKTIGEGTFGKVKLGIHNITGEKVAVKILEKEKIKDESDVERVSRELKILKKLRHPHIIQLYEIIETRTSLYLIMEFAPQGELFEYIVECGRVPEKEASRIFQQIVHGIEYLHKLKIVHRDLKPENLLLDHRRNIKIVDFGLSNLYENDELLKTACGSPCYAAPEMIAGKKYLGLTVDLWSLGVILFALICGYLPFEDPQTSNLYKKIMAGEFKIPKHVSHYGNDLLSRLLTTDPEKRIKIDEIKKHPWFSLSKQDGNAPQGLIVGIHQIPIDKDILNILDNLGMDKEKIRESLLKNEHNALTATYYLIVKRHSLEGTVSISDITSPFFRPKLILQEKSENKGPEPIQQQRKSEGGSKSPERKNAAYESQRTPKDQTPKEKVIEISITLPKAERQRKNTLQEEIGNAWDTPVSELAESAKIRISDPPREKTPNQPNQKKGRVKEKKQSSSESEEESASPKKSNAFDSMKIVENDHSKIPSTPSFRGKGGASMNASMLPSGRIVESSVPGFDESRGGRFEEERPRTSYHQKQTSVGRGYTKIPGERGSSLPQKKHKSKKSHDSQGTPKHRNKEEHNERMRKVEERKRLMSRSPIPEQLRNRSPGSYSRDKSPMDQLRQTLDYLRSKSPNGHIKGKGSTEYFLLPSKTGLYKSSTGRREKNTKWSEKESSRQRSRNDSLRNSSREATDSIQVKNGVNGTGERVRGSSGSRETGSSYETRASSHRKSKRREGEPYVNEKSPAVVQQSGVMDSKHF